jgi:hypothetical protein
MLYRKSPPNPPKLLLRIVATASAGAIAGACSSTNPSSGSPSVLGKVPYPVADAEADAVGSPSVMGSLPAMAGDAGFVGGGTVCHPCGVVPIAESDAGADGASSPAPSPDAGVDGQPHEGPGDAAPGCGNGGVCGVVVAPQDAGDSDHIVLGLVANPDGGA